MTGIEFATVAFAFGLGAVTFFAPCAYPLLPGYVSFFLGRDDGESGGTGGSVTGGASSLPARLAGAAGVGLAASAGFFVVYGLLTGAVVVAGSAWLGAVALLEPVVGLVLVAMGGLLLAGRSTPTAPISLPTRRRSVFGYAAFGVLYAAAAAGCSAPLFVAVVLRGFTDGPAAGLAAMAAYAAGMGALMVGVTVLAALGRTTAIRRLGGRREVLTRLAGLLLVLAGAVEIYLYLFRFGGLAALGLA